MRDYANYWGNLSRQEMPHRIITGAKDASDLRPTSWVLSKLSGQKRILDFGCGIGRNTFPLAEAGHEVTAYDLPNMIAALKDDPRMVSFGSRIVATWDWGNASSGVYDAVLASLVIQHLPVDVADEYLATLCTVAPLMLVHSRAYMDFNGGPVLSVMERHFAIDQSRMGLAAIGKAKECSGEGHFWAWMIPKGVSG